VTVASVIELRNVSGSS